MRASNFMGVLSTSNSLPIVLDCILADRFSSINTPTAHVKPKPMPLVRDFAPLIGWTGFFRTSDGIDPTRPGVTMKQAYSSARRTPRSRTSSNA